MHCLPDGTYCRAHHGSRQQQPRFLRSATAMLVQLQVVSPITKLKTPVTCAAVPAALKLVSNLSG